MLPSLKVKIGADTSGLDEGLSRSQKNLARFAKAAAAAGVAVGVAMLALAKRSMATVDSQAKLSQSLGTTVESIQVLERAGELAGISMGQVEQYTKDLTRRLSQAATGAGPAVSALQRLNLSAADLASVPLDQKIAMINEAIAEFIPEAERAAVAGQLFGEEGSLAISRLNPELLRQAAKDIKDFGVAVSDVDASKIEAMNDALTRIKLVLVGIGNKVAVAIAPIIEGLATAFANSARAGGALNTALQFVSDNLARLATYIAVVVTGFGVRFVASMVAAKLAAFSLSGALASVSAGLVFLRGALIRTGFGAIIVLAGELVYQFIRLFKATGSFATALGLMKDVAVEVFGRIGMAFGLIPAAIRVGSAKMNEIFIRAIGKMAYAFIEFTWAIADGMNNLFGTDLRGASASITQELNKAAIEANGVTDSLKGAYGEVWAATTAPLESIAALKAALASADEEGNGAFEGAAGGADRLTDAAGGAAKAVDALGGAADVASEKAEAAFVAMQDRIQQIASGLKSTMESGFMSMIDGTKSAKDAFKDMAKGIIAELYRVLVVQRLVGNFSAGGGGILGGVFSAIGGGGGGMGLFGGGRATGGPVSGGQPYMVGERGPEMFIPQVSGRVANASMTRLNAGQGGGGVVVYQTIQITTGIQQTVRAEIMSLMPRIAEVSKGAMLDAKLRGGSYGAAFR